MKKIVVFGIIVGALSGHNVYAKEYGCQKCIVKKTAAAKKRTIQSIHRKNVVAKKTTPETNKTFNIQNSPLAHDADMFIQSAETELVPVQEYAANRSQIQYIENSSIFYAGLEGGISLNKLNNRPFVNWAETYRWNNEQQARAGAVKIYFGVNLKQNIALETGMFTSTSIKRSRADANPTKQYSTKIKVSGIDLVMRYLSTDVMPGVFVKAGIAYVQSAGRSQLPYQPNWKPPVGEVHTAGTNSSVNLELGVGYLHPLNDDIDIVMSATRYQTLIQEQQIKTDVTIFSAGAIYHF